MDFMKHLTTLAARFFMSAIFLISGVNKIFHWRATENELIRVLGDWESLVFSTTAHTAIAQMMAWSPGFLILATLLELLGGLLLLLGVRDKLGAFLLILFLIPATFLFHQFWFLEGSARDMQISFFLRNIAIIGGLMMVVLNGTQSHSGRGNRFSSEHM
jgi:putative oxidoreductase